MCDLRWKIGTGSEFTPSSSILSFQRDSTNDTYGTSYQKDKREMLGNLQTQHCSLEYGGTQDSTRKDNFSTTKQRITVVSSRQNKRLRSVEVVKKTGRL